MKEFQKIIHRINNAYLGMPWEIEYQVLEGGDLDIDFMVISPRGVILVDEKRSEEGLHEITATDKGDYQVKIREIQL